MKFIPLEDNPQLLDAIFAHLDSAWQQLGNPQSLLPELEKKRPLIEAKTIKGIVGLEGDDIACFAWVDLPNGHYGNAVVHINKPTYEALLVHALIQSHLLDGVAVELVQFIEGFAFRDAFIHFGFHEKERQRMFYDFEKKPVEHPELSESIHFAPIRPELNPTVASISYDAHEIRQKIEGYSDFNDIHKREMMCQRIRNGEYGPEVTEASVLASYENEPAGICEILSIPCWGEENVAWYMDVAVRPRFQGLGLAQDMMKFTLFQIQESGHKLAGLAVTLSNKPAVRLYESVGFECSEFFVEVFNMSSEASMNPILQSRS